MGSGAAPASGRISASVTGGSISARGRVTSPRPTGLSVVTLRTPQAPDLLVESILHWEGKATAVWQLAERAVCAQSLGTVRDSPGSPHSLHLPPPAVLCQPHSTCPFQRTSPCLVPAPGLLGTKCWRCPFTLSRESIKGREDMEGFLGSNSLASAKGRAVLGHVGPRWGQSWRGDRRWHESRAHGWAGRCGGGS